MTIEKNEVESVKKMLSKWQELLPCRYKQMYYFLDTVKADELHQKTMQELCDIAIKFLERKMYDAHFLNEIFNDDNGKYEQRMSEIMFFDYLDTNGFSVESKLKKGPDFKSVKDGNVIWFEVVTPLPLNLTDEQNQNISLEPNPENNHKCYCECLQKILSVIDNKSEKIKQYRRDNIIKENDAAVIVVNDTLFSPNDSPMNGLSHCVYKGASGLPLVFEAVCSIGLPFFMENPIFENIEIVRKIRDTFINKNGSPIATNAFLCDSSSHLSGIIQLTLREDSIFRKIFPGYFSSDIGVFLHNENALNKVTKNLPSLYNCDFSDVKNVLDVSSDGNGQKAMQTLTFYGALNAFTGFLSKNGYQKKNTIKNGLQ